MKNKRLAALLAILISFVLFLHVPVKVVEKDLVPHYNQFMSLYNHFCSGEGLPNKLIVGFGSLEGSVIGLCSQRYNTSIITIDTVYWLTSSDTVQKQLLFHELTHCLLDVGHVERYPSAHYMAPYMEDLSEPTLILQTIEVMNDICSKED